MLAKALARIGSGAADMEGMLELLRGGRGNLRSVEAPTRLIVGGEDDRVIDLN